MYLHNAHLSDVYSTWMIINLCGAGWLLAWSIKVLFIRRSEKDPFAGEFLAVSWGLMMLAVIVGSGYRIHMGEDGFTPTLPIISLALLMGMIARVKARKFQLAVKRGEKPPANGKPRAAYTSPVEQNDYNTIDYLTGLFTHRRKAGDDDAHSDR